MIGSQHVCGLATEKDRTFQQAGMELRYAVYLAKLVAKHTSVFPSRAAVHPNPLLSISCGIILASLLISNGVGGFLYLQRCLFII